MEIEMVMEASVEEMAMEVIVWRMVVMALVEERKGSAGEGGERRMYVDVIWI